VVEAPKTGLSLPTWNRKSVSAHRPVGPTQNESSRNKKNEIFVDIVERVTVLMSTNGSLINSAIDGQIQMKSFLMGNPELRLALNEDLVIRGQQFGGSAYGAVTLDDCNFHDCVNLDEFSHSRILSFFPPDGGFAVMNYRITGDVRAPFSIFPFVEQQSPSRIEITIKVRADIPEANYGSDVKCTCILPKSTATCAIDLNANDNGSGGKQAGSTGQSAEYVSAEHKLIWTTKKFKGGTEAVLKAKVSLQSPMSSSSNVKKEVGPVSLSFECPMYNASNLQVKYLRVAEQYKSYNPCRWVRYITQSSSYVCRF
jgi:AP-4 complex subunit mu-1